VSTLTGDTSTTNYLQYDALGRVLASNQVTYGNTYPFSYSYNLAGGLTGETYPSSRVVSTCYDGANRVSQVTLGACGGGSGNYAASVQYAAQGAATQYAVGNNVWRHLTYNPRLQVSGWSDLLNNSANSTLLSGSLNWGTTGNNGNLQGAAYSNGGPGYATPLTFNQSFTSDGVNRMKTATDSGGWSRSAAYDAYGNMTPSGNPAPRTMSFNGNNQLVGQTSGDDQAGSELSVYGNALGYDYEGHITSKTDGVTQAVETYVFDGDGERVEKYNAASRTVFVYDALGRMAAEYATATHMPTCITCYLSQDHLGTARLVTDQNGNVVGRRDYLPFGEEILANTAYRNGQWGTGNDSINQKFTGKGEMQCTEHAANLYLHFRKNGQRSQY
jgi:hypothetical protein